MIYLISAYILNIVDYLFTSHWVSKYGVSIEVNPIGRWLFSHDIVGFVYPEGCIKISNSSFSDYTFADNVCQII